MMTRQIKALLLSCGLHATLVLAIMGAVRTTVSVPLRIDLTDFTMLDACGVERSGPVLPGAGAVGQARKSAEPVADSSPVMIVQRRQKVMVRAPRLEALAAEETPPAEPARTESSVQEETAAAEGDPATEPEPESVLNRPVVSASGPVGPASSEPSNPAAIATAAGRGAVTGHHSQTSQEQYLTNHFAGIRDRILRNLHYPAVARKKGWSGQVRLCFHIDHKGGVEDITVLVSSGYDLLDRQAMEVVRRVAPFPLPLENAEIIMPITFCLTR